MDNARATVSSAVNSSDANRLELLKVKRESFKEQIFSLESLVGDYKETPHNRLKLQERLERLKNYLNDFGEVQDEITMIDKREEVQRAEILEDYDNAVASAKLLLGVETNVSETVAAGSQTSPALTFNLPKLEFPKFDGRMENWMAFKDTFTSMVHNEAGLSNVQKLAHLRCSLNGEAKNVLDGFITTEENYERAWKHLLENYDNKRWLVMHYVENILKTPEMSDETADSFQRTLGHMQQHVRWLQVLGRTAEDIGNDLLIGILSAKMTPKAHRAWVMSLTDTEMPTIENIYKYMRLASHQPNEPVDDSARDKNNATKEISAKPATTPKVFCPNCNAYGYAIEYCPTCFLPIPDDEW